MLANRIIQASEASERYEAALERTRASVRATIEQLVHPLADRGIPWAVTFGNHDFQCGLEQCGNRKHLQGISRMREPWAYGRRERPRRKFGKSGIPRKAGFVQLRSDFGICRISAYSLASPAHSHCRFPDVDHTMSVLGLVLLDSGDYARSGGYGSSSAAALRFLAICRKRWRRNRRKIGKKPRNRRNRRSRAWYSSIFRCNSITNCLSRPRRMRRVRLKDTAISLENITFWMRRKTLPGSYLGEGVSCPDADSGEFAILTAGGLFCRFPRA